MNFQFGSNGILMALGVPIFKHFRVYEKTLSGSILSSREVNGRQLQKLSSLDNMPEKYQSVLL